ncbi:hypothetical protein MITS9508_01911 [Synechococcus sp. MIT S9508]|nr:hypothetical protein MITS9508_01911 [Synechococcus sp. MIT S9508]
MGYVEHPNLSAELKNSTGPTAVGFGPAADIKTIKADALRIVQDDSIESKDRMVHLKDATRDVETEFSNQELKQYIWDARRELAGAAKPVPRGGKLKLSKARWLWTGVVMAATTTLVIALPKVGKSRLMTMVLGRIRRGDHSFLGQALPGAEPLILIVGPDQTENDWQECLLRAGLSDAEGNVDDAIVGVFHKGCPLHLDESGIDQIVEFCRAFPDLIILLDSYAAATAALGLEEKSASYADPLLDLQEAIAPYNASLIVIHHSNRHSAKGRASSASRGTTALPAAVSQTVSLAWVSDPEDNPLAPADYRVKVTTEGRAGRPLDLLIEQVDDGSNWISHGSAAEVARQQAMEEILDKLPERQSGALRDMTHHWVTTKLGMDRPHLGAALGLDRKRSKEVMDALLQKKLIQFDRERSARGDGRGQPTRLFRPVDAVLPFFPATDLSDISDPVSPPASEPLSERSEKSDAPQERACLECGKTFTANTRGRPGKYCSTKCKDRAASRARRNRLKDSDAGQFG